MFVLSTISMFGLGAILLASSALFLAVKIVGAIYLLYLGVCQFNKRSIFKTELNSESSENKSFRQCLIIGFLVAVTNPKPIIFFIALFPAFLDTSKAILPQFLIMTSTFMCISFCTLLVYGKISRSAKSLLYNESRIQTFNRVSGAIFVAMAAGLLMVDAKKQ